MGPFYDDKGSSKRERLEASSAKWESGQKSSNGKTPPAAIAPRILRGGW